MGGGHSSIISQIPASTNISNSAYQTLEPIHVWLPESHSRASGRHYLPVTPAHQGGTSTPAAAAPHLQPPLTSSHHFRFRYGWRVAAGPVKAGVWVPAEEAEWHQVWLLVDWPWGRNKAAGSAGSQTHWTHSVRNTVLVAPPTTVEQLPGYHLQCNITNIIFKNISNVTQ